jgi:nucleoside-diphosphate-sugar epimerase
VGGRTRHGGGTARSAAACQAGVKRVLMSAFGWSGWGTREIAGIHQEDSSNVDSGIAPYQKSKTLLEKAAWDFVAEHGDIELAVVNPVGAFGPVQVPPSGRGFAPGKIGYRFGKPLAPRTRMTDGELCR